MKILDIQILKGPNIWSVNHKVVVIKLDIGRYEDLPSDRLGGFTERLLKTMPGLNDHHCSEGKPGGFVERLTRGTWMGHIVEHIAIELQNLAGIKCNFGKTRSTGLPRVYDIAFEYNEERAGEYSALAAIKIADALASGFNYNITNDVDTISRIYTLDRPGPTTLAIIEAAAKRKIPFMRLDTGSLVQLGYGSARKRIEASLTENTSIIAVELAADKHKTKLLLAEAGVPVSEGVVIGDISELPSAIDRIGFPVVIKPNDGNQGKGVSLNINTLTEAGIAFHQARNFSARVLIEKFCPGNDYRLLVINFRMIAASRRIPASVTGDGTSTILELIERTNRNPDRGEGHEKILTKIKTDHVTEEFLRSQGLEFDDVPRQGRRIMLAATANLSTGGSAEDVTDHVNPEVSEMAARIAKITGLDICGIDIIAEDISKPVREGKVNVIEVNAAPGFRMHTNPSAGKQRPAGEAVIDMLFPGRSDGRIPVIAVTGTNGKTTTTRLIAHIAGTAGYTVGFTATEGIYIGGRLVEEGDCTGPVSASRVLRDPTVNFAVLECARGGILRAGLAFDKCNTGIVTNVAEDHLGSRGINSLKEMAMVKAIVPESVKKTGFAILNAEDDSTYKMKDRVKCRVALFSVDEKSVRIRGHCTKGGLAAVYRKGYLVLVSGENEIMKIDVSEIPGAFGGKAPFMIENILAAMLAAWTNDIEPAVIKEALSGFEPTYENSPGRMNLYRFHDFTFLLDYAHNFHSISALGAFMRQSGAVYKTGIVSAAGDRRDIDLFNIGKASAMLFDKIIIRVDEDTRGREESEIIELIYSGIVSTKKNYPVEIIKDESEAASYALRNAVPGSLIVHFAEKIRKVVRVLEDYRQEIYETEMFQK